MRHVLILSDRKVKALRRIVAYKLHKLTQTRNPLPGDYSELIQLQLELSKMKTGKVTPARSGL